VKINIPRKMQIPFGYIVHHLGWKSEICAWCALIATTIWLWKHWGNINLVETILFQMQIPVDISDIMQF